VTNSRFAQALVAVTTSGCLLLVVPVAAHADEVVTPGAEIADGQAVSVTGTARGAHQVQIYECATTAGQGAHFDRTQCDPGNVVSVTPAPDGSYATRYVVQDPFVRADGHEVDCSTEACEVVSDDPRPDTVVGAMRVIGKACRTVFDAPDPGSVAISTSAGPSGGVVGAGTTISVDLTWDPTSFASNPGGVPGKVVDCVRVDGKVDATLSRQVAPGPAGGTQELSFVVPDQPGAQVCVRGAVGAGASKGDRADSASRGDGGARGARGAGRGVTETSAVVCDTVGAAPVLPEAPAAAVLPVSGAVVGLGALLVMRRRRLRGAPGRSRRGRPTTPR